MEKIEITMQFMNCNACRTLVQVNPTGICLGCQMGFSGPQADAWKPDPTQSKVETSPAPETDIVPPKRKRKRKSQ